MSERLLANSFEFDERQTEVVRDIGHSALLLATDRYSSGYPNYRGGDIRKLGHNNARHGLMTGNDAARLANFMGLSPSEQELERAAGYAHDLRQLTGRGNDEKESAEWIESRLDESGIIPPAAAKLAARAILGTLPIFENGRLVDQTANRLAFASKRDELFVKVLASGDTGELYTPFGPYSAHMLYGQRVGAEPGDIPDMTELLAFQAKQILLLESYRYPIPEAAKLFATHHTQVMEYVQRVYGQLERGEIETWQQLIDQDIAFMHDPDGNLMRDMYEIVA
jgi:hypothetical protein